MYRSHVSLAVAIAAALSVPFAAHSVQTQDAASSASQTSSNGANKNTTTLKSVVVSASRIDFVNIVAVTPTVSFTPQNLQLSTYNNVGDALSDLPYFSGAGGPRTQGTQESGGATPINLRGLGSVRSLLLVDGHRIAGSNDLNSIPSILVKGVDVVTGGASAAWGSGAVTGVVNITLNNNFTGFKIDAGYGQSSDNDDKTRTLRLAGGTDFAGGKGHFEVGGDFGKSGGILRSSRFATYKWTTLPVPGKTNVLERTQNVGSSNQTMGGLILTGVLAGKMFAPDGSLQDHVLERTVGSLGVGDEAPSLISDGTPAIAPEKHYNVLANVRYDLTDNIRISMDVRHSLASANYAWLGDGAGPFPIGIDNAFLPSAVRDALVNASQTSFLLGRFNRYINFPRMIATDKVDQATVKLDGVTGNLWHWTGYYSHGVDNLIQNTPGFILTKNMAQSVDSVVSPTTGRSICRVALTNPATNCVPINLFGEGAPSQAAQDYVTGGPLGPHNNATNTLDEFGFSLRGEPWELPAGNIGVATGVEARREAVNTVVGALDNQKAFTFYSFSPMRGSVTVKEVFGEVNVPILSGKPGFQDLAADVAVRGSDYTTSGKIWSWKAGLTNEFVDGLRTRVAYSRDIRAPSLSELNQQGYDNYSNLFDPVLNQTYLVRQSRGGNKDLKPETSNTLTAGLSWAPMGSLSGVILSADYFNIDITNIITTLGAQSSLDRCLSGNASICSRIIRAPDGTIVLMYTNFINLSEFKEDGVDLEAGYSWNASLFGAEGQFRTRTVATWVHKLITSDGVSTVNTAASPAGMPRWTAVSSMDFLAEKFSIGARVRYFSAGKFSNTQNIVNNRIGQYFYGDLNGTYALTDADHGDLQLYASIRNVANKRSPNGGGSAFYDVIGRFITTGIRLQF